MPVAVLASIKPHYCGLIEIGDKSLEIRKNKPKLKPPFTVYIYETKTPLRWNKAHNGIVGVKGGIVIGAFVCDEIIPIKVFDNGTIQDWNANNLERACVPYEEMAEYIGWGKRGYAWHISDLIIYDEPKPLSDYGEGRPPQSWCYVQE